jgi:membrane-anchored protein YejM (alkaline phosphatase superfamily)
MKQRLLLSYRWASLFVFANIILALASGLTYLTHFPPQDSLFTFLFGITSYLAQISFITLLITAIPIVVITLVLPFRHFAVLTFAFLFTIVLCSLVGDAFVFNHYRFHVNMSIINMVFSGDILNVLDLSTMEISLIIGLITVAFISETAFGYWLWSRIQHRRTTQSAPLKSIILISLSLMLVSEGMYAWGYATNQQNVTWISHSLPLYQGITANRFLLKHKLITEKQLTTTFTHPINSKRAGLLRYPAHLIHDHIKKPLNVVIIGIDAWRHDSFTAQNTPAIYKFSKHAWIFKNHYSGGNCTKSGLFTLFYGLPATYWNNMHSAPVLFQALKKHKYKTGIYISAGLIYPPFYKNIFSNIPNLEIKLKGDTAYQHDQHITKKALTFLNQAAKDKKPFFLFTFYDSAHGYAFPPNYPLKFKPSSGIVNRLSLNHDYNPTPFFNRYKNALLYTDSLVKQQLKRLKKLGLLKNTIVIITTDHGEEFNDNHLNYWGHSSNFTRYQTQIPLIIHWPNGKEKFINTKTSSYDMAPTLMETLFHVSNPSSDYSIGNSLVKPIAWKNLLVTSYVFSGVITAKNITRFYPGGYFQVNTLSGKKIPNKMAAPKVVKWYLQKNTEFYR